MVTTHKTTERTDKMPVISMMDGKTRRTILRVYRELLSDRVLRESDIHIPREGDVADKDDGRLEDWKPGVLHPIRALHVACHHVHTKNEKKKTETGAALKTLQDEIDGHYADATDVLRKHGGLPADFGEQNEFKLINSLGSVLALEAAFSAAPYDPAKFGGPGDLIY
jgi:hypothetical protein